MVSWVCRKADSSDECERPGDLPVSEICLLSSSGLVLVLGRERKEKLELANEIEAVAGGSCRHDCAQQALSLVPSHLQPYQGGDFRGWFWEVYRCTHK